jgi:nucleotide-binding universal stress UspA family protein
MYANILVAVDGSEASTCALMEALMLAKEQGSKLRLVHVVRRPLLDYGFNSDADRENVIKSLCESGKAVLARAETVARKQGAFADCLLFEAVSGSAASVILDQAHDWPADLIVMGSHARSGGHRVGSDTAAVLQAASAPVLLVRAPSVEIERAEHRQLEYAPSAAVSGS